MSGTALTFPSSALDSSPFTAEEKVWIRDLCGYPVYGGTAAGFGSYRFFTAYGELEYRLVDGNMAPNEYQLARQYVSDLLPLRAAILAASATLNVGSAAVYTRNKNEMAERNRLYRQWRLDLCGCIQVPPGPKLADQNTASIVI